MSLLRIRSLTIALCAAVLLPGTPAFGDAHIRNTAVYESAASALRNAPSEKFQFSGARLSDVLRMLAEQAGINFISLPGDENDASRLVTFTFEMSPFSALETLAHDNGIALVYNKGGLWSLKPSNSSELIAKNYHIRYNTREKIEVSGGGGGGGGSRGVGGGAGGQGGGISTGIDISTAEPKFEVEPSQLIEDVKTILGIKAASGAILSGDAYLQAISGGIGGGGALTPQVTNLVNPGPAEDSAKVIWNGDSNSLFVVATLQQHKMVAEYLKSADRPQNLIAVEVKFFETTKDPKRQLGIDWSGTLGDNGIDLGLSGLSTDVDLNFLKNTVAPQSAVLDSTDVNATVRALVSDSETTQVSYPRVLTVSNREVVINSVINEPVLAASSSTTPGAGATTTSAVQYLPIGTVINILPREMANNTVALDVQLTVSSIIGERIIQGNPYPVASSRVYGAPLRVQSGYTVAIAGLDEAVNTDGKTRVPVMGRLPVVGNLFRDSSRRHSRKNLMMFITPTLLRTNTQGVSERPHAVFTEEADRMRHRYGSGKFADNTTLQWDRELFLLERKVDEGMARKEDKLHIDAIYSESASRLEVTKALSKTRAMSASDAQARMAAFRAINERADRLRKRIRWRF